MLPSYQYNTNKGRNANTDVNKGRQKYVKEKRVDSAISVKEPPRSIEKRNLRIFEFPLCEVIAGENECGETLLLKNLAINCAVIWTEKRKVMLRKAAKHVREKKEFSK